ncbi:MAG: RNA polymerase sigma factor [Candidatus Blackburnbacteria bacterium]|nr:RNA polymerase sigma factor [Candidatus Blackburnbacteria bacterium]
MAVTVEAPRATRARQIELDTIITEIKASTLQERSLICTRLVEADRRALYKTRGELVALSTIAGRDFEAYVPPIFEQSVQEAGIPLVPVAIGRRSDGTAYTVTTLPAVDIKHAQARLLADERLRPFLKKEVEPTPKQAVESTEQAKPGRRSGTTQITKSNGVVFAGSNGSVTSYEWTSKRPENIPVVEVTPEVIVRAQAGDHEAFEVIFDRYQSAIYNYAYRLTGNREDAFDLTQDTFLKVYQGLPKTQLGLRLNSWLYRIATNTCLDELRHRKTLKGKPWEDFMSVFHSSQVSREDPERSVLDKENQEEVQLILNLMHPRHRMCLILREYHGLSCDEIAEVLETTRTAVRTLFFKAKARFREIYARSKRQPQILPQRRVLYAGNRVR